MQLINDISSDLQKLFRYFNGTGVAAFLKIPFAPSARVFPNNLVLHMKDLKIISILNIIIKVSCFILTTP